MAHAFLEGRGLHLFQFIWFRVWFVCFTSYKRFWEMTIRLTGLNDGCRQSYDTSSGEICDDEQPGDEPVETWRITVDKTDCSWDTPAGLKKGFDMSTELWDLVSSSLELEEVLVGLKELRWETWKRGMESLTFYKDHQRHNCRESKTFWSN